MAKAGAGTQVLSIPFHPIPVSKQPLEVQPLRSHCHTLLRGRGGHTGQGREGTSLNVRDGRKEGARLGSLLPEKGREGERR